MDVNVEDVSTDTEEESSQDGVTGMTVNIPPSGSAGDEMIPAGAASEETATEVEAKERAIGPAEQIHANVRTMVERWKSISAFGLCLELSNEREDDRQDKTTGQNGKENSGSNGDLRSALSDSQRKHPKEAHGTRELVVGSINDSMVWHMAGRV